MQEEGYETVSTDPVFRAVRSALPWVVLAAVVWVLYGAWTGFTRTRDLAAQTTAPVVTTTSTVAPSAATTVTGMVAVARASLTLRAQPDKTSEALATAKKGATLTILSKQATFFRVRDKIGHIGWIENDSALITVRKS